MVNVKPANGIVNQDLQSNPHRQRRSCENTVGSCCFDLRMVVRNDRAVDEKSPGRARTERFLSGALGVAAATAELHRSG